MRKHPSTLKRANIPKDRYEELQAICKQYADYIDGYGGEEGRRRAEYIRALTQKAAADNAEWEEMLESVTTGRTIKPEYSNKAFIMRRMLFYVALDQALGY